MTYLGKKTAVLHNGSDQRQSEGDISPHPEAEGLRLAKEDDF
jgi:hypothetical protein